MVLLFTVGSVPDVEYHYFLLLISVLYLLNELVFTALEIHQESSFFLGDEEVLRSCSDQLSEVCLLNVTYITMVNYQLSCLIV